MVGWGVGTIREHFTHLEAAIPILLNAGRRTTNRLQQV